MGKVWNSSLERRKPLKRKAVPVSSGRNYKVNSENTNGKKIKSIEKISKPLAEKMKIYHKIRVVFLTLFSRCKAELSGCTAIATDIHHKRGRGIYLLTIKYFMPVCRSCHDWIGVNSEESIRRGLSLSRNKAEPAISRYLQPNFIDTKKILQLSGQKITIIN